MDTRPSWERGDDETAKAFAAFSIYRDMPASERSLGRVRRKLGKRGGYLGLLERWSTKYRWVQRSRDYDVALDSERRQAQEREIAEMNKRQAKMGMILQKIGFRRLLGMVDTMDGKTVLMALSKAIDMERLARGEPADTQDVKIPRKRPEDYTDEELDILIEQIKKDHGLS